MTQLTGKSQLFQSASRSRISLCSPTPKSTGGPTATQFVQLRATAKKTMELDNLSDEPEESDNVRLLSETYDIDKKGLRSSDKCQSDLSQNGFIRPMSYPVCPDPNAGDSGRKRLTAILHQQNSTSPFPLTTDNNINGDQSYPIFCAVAQYRESLDGPPLVGPNIATTL